MKKHLIEVLFFVFRALFQDVFWGNARLRYGEKQGIKDCFAHGYHGRSLIDMNVVWNAEFTEAA